MKIHLVIPPSAFLLDDRCFPFLGPLQIGAVARNFGHEVKVHDLTGYKQRHPEVVHADPEVVLDDAWALLKVGVEEDVALVGFYSLAAQHPHVVELARRLRAWMPNIKTCIGGPHANTAPESCVEDGFDWVVVADQGGGGGEAGFLEVLARLEGEAPRSLMGDPKIMKVTSRKGVEFEGDEWPLPARDLIDLESYHYSVVGERATSIISTTGCPFACTFCSHWGAYRKLEIKSAKRVAEEIGEIKSRYGWRGIMDYSDEANLRPDFQDEYLPTMRSLGVVWRAFFKNGRHMTREDVFEQMDASGCVELCTGGESAT